MLADATLPRWDMTVVFPGLDSREFENEFQAVIRNVSELAELFDGHQVEKKSVATVDETTINAFESVTQAYAALIERLETLYVYIYSFVSTDSRDDLAQARMSELQQHLVQLSTLGTRYIAWIGSLNVDALIDRSVVAREHGFLLRRAQVESQHLMSPAEEALAAELRVSGSRAWQRLHGDITSQLMVPMEVNGEIQTHTMSVVRNMAHDPVREVRQRAYEAEIEAWSKTAVPLAAALNGIKGETNTLQRRRGWEAPLDAALFENNIDRETLDTMLEVARLSFPDFRRYLRVKARALQVPMLAWYDLFAPLGASNDRWEFDHAVGFLLEQFGTYSPELRAFGERAFRERWIDAEPRSGKRDGAFCMGLRQDESRILANFNPTYDGMSTLAHELGHAYHNFHLAKRSVLQRDTPMTLAETASNFCQLIVREAALSHADAQNKIAILEASLSDACQVVVDISSRFLFEQAVFGKRSQREVSVDELRELMLDAQRDTYGDGLDPSLLHEYMWAAKPHYYGSTLYNYPYMFGLLFSTGLYARYQQDPETFKAGYDDLLSCTGMADAASLAARFDIDIRSSDFWRSSLDFIRDDINRFEMLIDESASAHG